MENWISTSRVIEHAGQKVVVDDLSIDFLKGATLDWEDEIVGKKFVVRCLTLKTLRFT